MVFFNKCRVTYLRGTYSIIISTSSISIIIHEFEVEINMVLLRLISLIH